MEFTTVCKRFFGLFLLATFGLACADDESTTKSENSESAYSFNVIRSLTTSEPITAMAMSKINDDEYTDFAFLTSKGLTIALQNKKREFVFNSPVPVGAKPNFVLLTDLDDDGIDDAVVTDAQATTLFVLMGKKDGEFGKPSGVTVGSYPSFILEGDLNSDSNRDLVVINRASNDVTILWGDGKGTFPTSLNLPVGTRPISAALADLNKDTNLDIVVVNESSDDLSVLMNTGQGAFEDSKTYKTGDGPTGIVLINVDDNSILDAVITAKNDNKMHLYLGGQSGDFSASSENKGAPFDTGAAPAALVAVDIDNDENLDLIVSNEDSNTLQILHGNDSGDIGTRSSTEKVESPGQIIYGNIDTNESIDLAVLNTKKGEVWLMLGEDPKEEYPARQDIQLGPTELPDAVVNVSYRAKVRAHNPKGNAVVVTSADLPSGLEFFVESSTIVITGRPTEAGDKTFTLTASDEEDPTFQRAQAFTMTVYSSAQGPTGKFLITTSSVSVNEPLDVLIKDIDRDNHQDILVAEAAENRVAVFWGKGKGKYVVSRYGVGARPVSLVSVDVDQDGREDILSLNMNSRDLVILKQTERQSFEAMAPIELDDTGTLTLTKQTVGDVNGDNYPDIAILSDSNKSICILLHTEDQSQPYSQSCQKIPLEFAPTDLVLRDFDGDGRDDLALTNSDEFGVSVFYLDSSQAQLELMNTPSSYSLPSRPAAITATHWNGDEILDLVVVSATTSKVSILTGVSGGTFNAAVSDTFSKTADSFSSLAAGDLDSDGRRDFVTTGFGKNEALIVRGDGQSGIQQTQTLPTGNGPVVVRAGDLNRDGVDDIVVANQLSGTLTLFMNGARLGPNTLPILGRPQSLAPVPSPINADDVKSLYSDHLPNNVSVDSWAANGSMTNVSDEVAVGNNVKAYSNLDSATIDFRSSPLNADRDRLTHLNLDVWAEEITSLTVKVVHRAFVNPSSGGQSNTEERFGGEKIYTVGGPAGLSLEKWTTLSLPLRELSGLEERTSITEIVLTVMPSGRSIFVDNVYFDNQGRVPMQGAPMPSHAASDVWSVFSDAYPNSGSEQSGGKSYAFSASTNVVSYPSNGGEAYYLYNLGTAEMVFHSPQDLSGMSHFHMDIFTSDATEFTIKIIDYGPDRQPDSISLGTDDSEGQVTLRASQLPHPLIRDRWFGIDIPIPDFAGLTSRSGVGKIVLTASQDSSSAFIDNIYFYENPTLDGGILYVDGGISYVDGGIQSIFCSDDSFEDNDTESTASVVTSPGTTSALKACPSDPDFYDFSLTAAAIFQADLTFTHAEGNLDLELYDPSGTLVVSAITATDNETISHTALTDGTYKLKVILQQDTGSSIGNDYDLTVAY